MVYGAFFCPLDEESKLTEMECADSKTLTEEAREKILEKLNGEKDFCGYALKVLSPHTISTGMLKRYLDVKLKFYAKIKNLNLRDKYNLNELSHDTAMSLVDEIYTNQKLNIGQVYLDTVGDPLKYEAKLKARFPKLNFKVSKKADSLYPCVSAASICAKVTRDSVLKNWIFNEKIEVKSYGSGYPGTRQMIFIYW
jgi:ribonuclease H2 subunit A